MWMELVAGISGNFLKYVRTAYIFSRHSSWVSLLLHQIWPSASSTILCFLVDCKTAPEGHRTGLSLSMLSTNWVKRWTLELTCSSASSPRHLPKTTTVLSAKQKFNAGADVLLFCERGMVVCGSLGVPTHSTWLPSRYGVQYAVIYWSLS